MEDDHGAAAEAENGFGSDKYIPSKMITSIMKNGNESNGEKSTKGSMKTISFAADTKKDTISTEPTAILRLEFRKNDKQQQDNNGENIEEITLRIVQKMMQNTKNLFIYSWNNTHKVDQFDQLISQPHKEFFPNVSTNNTSISTRTVLFKTNVVTSKVVKKIKFNSEVFGLLMTYNVHLSLNEQEQVTVKSNRNNKCYKMKDNTCKELKDQVNLLQEKYELLAKLHKQHTGAILKMIGIHSNNFSTIETTMVKQTETLAREISKAVLQVVMECVMELIGEVVSKAAVKIIDEKVKAMYNDMYVWRDEIQCEINSRQIERKKAG